MQRLLWTLVATCLTAALSAQDSQPPEENQAQERLKAMTARARLLQAEFADGEGERTLMRVEEPILRYSDPARVDVDGTLWLFTANRRPAAIACIFTVAPRTESWVYEFTSLTDQSLEVSGRPRWKWQPAEQKRPWIELPGEVPAEEGARLRALRRLAREFEVRETLGDEAYELRLLTQPLYRYADQSAGISDGALFAFSYGTNPECLVQIEAHEIDSGDRRWKVSFARLSSARLDVKHSGQIVWQDEEVRPPYRPREPYFSVWGPDPLPESP